jgi:hypothetical protein
MTCELIFLAFVYKCITIARGGDRGWQAGAPAPARKLFFQLSLDNLYNFS